MEKEARQPDYLLAPYNNPPPTHLIRTVGLLHTFLHTCPHAQTYEAYSPQFSATVWIPLPCNQWSCRCCAERKIRQLSVRTNQAKPNRLCTLTVDPALWESPRHAFDGTRRKVPELFRSLRARFKPIEYLRVTELTRRGWPHYHLLIRSPFLPHAVVRDKWKQLTGAMIVDLRQVKDSFVAYSYLVKYLSKMHQIGWTDRHVSYSKHFFPPKKEPDHPKSEFHDSAIIECHPATYLYERFRGAKLIEVGYNVFALNPEQSAVDDTVDPFDPPPGDHQAGTLHTPHVCPRSGSRQSRPADPTLFPPRSGERLPS